MNSPMNGMEGACLYRLLVSYHLENDSGFREHESVYTKTSNWPHSMFDLNIARHLCNWSLDIL